MHSAIGEALDFVYVGRVTYNSAFKKAKKYLKMPWYCIFLSNRGSGNFECFCFQSNVFNGNKRNQANLVILILKNSIFFNWICTFRGGAPVKIKCFLNFRDFKKEMVISEKRKSSSTSSSTYIIKDFDQKSQISNVNIKIDLTIFHVSHSRIWEFPNVNRYKNKNNFSSFSRFQYLANMIT